MARIKHGKNAIIDKLKTLHSYIKILKVVKIMFVSLFGLKVENVSINELSVTLIMSDEEGNNITAFFNSVDEVRDFSKKIRRAVMDEADKNWVRFERPTLITD